MNWLKNNIKITVFSAVIIFSFFSAASSFGEEEQNQKNAYEKLKVFSEILSLIESNYVEPTENDSMIEGAIRGMVKSLDPHTSYMPPASYKEMQVETTGKFGGLGIEISIRDGVLTVVSPIEETPAFRAGIKPGDKIIKIEDESTLDMTLQDAVTRLRGETGSPITITIFRKSFKAPKEFTIVRDIIKVRSIVSKLYENDIGYIKIRSFSKNTSSDLDKALEDLGQKGITKLILDVRNNPGGLLNQAVEVTDRFLNRENLIVYTKGRSDEQNMRFTSHDKVAGVTYPMIILVNGGSASASEIVAGALQDLNRAVILGTQTFGKGSVQTIIPLSDGSALRLTTARYYTPSGRVIQENGIMPDIVVEMRPVSKVEKKEDEEEEPEEKSRLRRFLREKDLKKHLKGKSSIEGAEEENSDQLEEAKKKELNEDLEKDNQLQQAVALLSGWEVMKKMFKNLKVITPDPDSRVSMK
ncbi:MAG: S41 family peptidase [Nitrospinae bacterium]|nr:S41 family peptidase [Nitrospinota bacterium]MZH06127.1 S41 family peptidase [Nitrospinota bacterium]MZH15538.1 S41 family peptidase [Nitrospinota bacterium]